MDVVFGDEHARIGCLVHKKYDDRALSCGMTVEDVEQAWASFDLNKALLGWHGHRIEALIHEHMAHELGQRRNALLQAEKEKRNTRARGILRQMTRVEWAA